MLKNRRLAVATALVAGGLLAACAEPPTQRVEETNLALQAAREAEAETYAPEALRQAGSTLEGAQQEIQAQNERFAIMRDYEEAEKRLGEAQEQARQAREQAVSEKEAARVEAQARLERSRAAIAAAEQALASAPRGKGTKADIAALTADLQALRNEVAALEAQIAAEEYYPAHDKADSIIASAEGIAQEIQRAVEMQAELLAKRRNR